MRQCIPILTLFLAAGVAGSGCGGRGNTVWVTGKLLKGAAPYVPPKGQVVNVTLVGLETQDEAGKTVQGGEIFWAEVDQGSGAFSVPGSDRQGIPPGRYRVAVTQKMTRETFEAEKAQRRKGVDRETDMLAGRFGPGTSPIIRQVKNGGELVLDLVKPGE